MSFLQRNWHIFLALAGVAIAVPAAIGVVHYLQSTSALTPPADSETALNSTVSNTTVAATDVNASVAPGEGEFVQKLAPYGSWKQSAHYGRVWQPRSVSRDWRPYTVGHWSHSNDDGWYWNSDEAWSDTYHYGRWYDDTSDGWVWVPGTEWAPSWVAWRQTDDNAVGDNGGYYGWAPLPPEGYGGYGAANQPIFDQPGLWTFVAASFLTSPHLHRVSIPYDRNVTIIRDTRVINNFGQRDGHAVNRGIDPQRAERFARRPLAQFDGQVPAPLRVNVNFNDNNRDHGNDRNGGREDRQDRIPQNMRQSVRQDAREAGPGQHGHLNDARAEGAQRPHEGPQGGEDRPGPDQADRIGRPDREAGRPDRPDAQARNAATLQSRDHQASRQPDQPHEPQPADQVPQPGERDNGPQNRAGRRDREERRPDGAMAQPAAAHRSERADRPQPEAPQQAPAAAPRAQAPSMPHDHAGGEHSDDHGGPRGNGQGNGQPEPQHGGPQPGNQPARPEGGHGGPDDGGHGGQGGDNGGDHHGH